MALGFYDFILRYRDDEKCIWIVQMVSADASLPRQASSGELYLYLLQSAKYHLHKVEIKELFRLYIGSIMQIS